MKVYCPTCGSGTDYSLEKPKFCASCGEAFTALNKVPPKRVFKASNQNPTVMVQEVEEEEEFEAPLIEKLDFEMSASSGFQVTKIQDLVGTKQEGLDDGYVREADSSYSKDTIKEDFFRDAGSSKRTDVET